MSAQILPFEGNSFSGKTTTYERVIEKYSLPGVDEYVVYAGGGMNFPAFPPDSYGDAKRSIDFFLELEYRRTQDAVDLGIQTDKIVLMDRSPLSCLTFQFTVKQNMPEIPNAYSYALELFLKAHSEKKIIIPGGYIYIEPESSEIFLQRVERRGRVPIDFLNNVSTLNQMRSWYSRLASRLTPESSLLLKSKEGDIDYTAFLAYDFISKYSPDKDIIQILSDMLDEEA